MIQVKPGEFRKTLDSIAKNKNHETIMDYLRITGMIMNARDGFLNIDDHCVDKLKFFTSEVELGDIVWVGHHGVLLVTDKHPKANDDGHHYRAIRVAPAEDGSYKIIGHERTIIIDDNETFRLKHTSFDVAKIDRLTYERYEAYAHIDKINNELSNMKET